MSSSNSASTVDVRLQPSLRAFQAVFVLHLFPAGLIPFAMQPGTPMLLLIAAIGASWLWLRRHPAFGYGARAISRITAHADGHWTIGDARAEAQAAELLPHSLVHPWLLVLNFRLADGSRRTRVMAGDEADADALRRLRVRLSASG